MLLIGEGTADIQRMIIGRRLLEDYKRRTSWVRALYDRVVPA